MAVLVGIFLEVISGMVGVIGKQLIGYSARHSEAKYAQAIGMFMTTILGAVLDAIAYGFAPQSILAPLHGMEISMNVIFAPCVLHEKVAPAHIIGTLFVAAGASLTAVYGPHDAAPVSLETLEAKLFRWQVAAYILACGLGVLLCFAILRVRPRGSGDKIRGIVLGIVAGGISGNMCFLKCTMELLMVGLGGDWSPWTHWLPYALAVLAASVAIGNVPLMVTALQEYEALFMVTVFGGANIIMACISGAVVLREMDGVDETQNMQYWASVFLILCGLFAINTAEVHGIDADKGCDIMERDKEEQSEDISPMARRLPLRVLRSKGSIGSMDELRERTVADGRVAIFWATPVAGFRAAGKTPSSSRRRSRSWTGQDNRASPATLNSFGPPLKVSFHLDGPDRATTT
jgi:hypothetical protein